MIKFLSRILETPLLIVSRTSRDAALVAELHSDPLVAEIAPVTVVFQLQQSCSPVDLWTALRSEVAETLREQRAVHSFD